MVMGFDSFVIFLSGLLCFSWISMIFLRVRDSVFLCMLCVWRLNAYVYVCETFEKKGFICGERWCVWDDELVVWVFSTLFFSERVFSFNLEMIFSENFNLLSPLLASGCWFINLIWMLVSWFLFCPTTS